MNSLLLFIVLSLVICTGGKDEETREDRLWEEYWSTCQYLQNNGYPCENHKVTTKDGYILTLHRIPYGKKRNNISSEDGDVRPVTFLQHGIMQSSVDWVINGPEKSLGFLLAERGYDVWLGNSRGNAYSKEHTEMSPDDKEFWDFSFTEMAMHDLPASIDYALRRTGERELYYIGHSQGSTIGFAAFSRNKTLAHQVRLFVGLAPIAYMEHAKGLLRVISRLSPIVSFFLRVLGTRNFLPSSWMTKYLASKICGTFLIRKMCTSTLFLTAGVSTQNIDIYRLPIYVSHTPAGTSVRNIMHFAQLLRGEFSMYDYGWNGNMLKYMQPFPPRYNIKKMKVPTALFTGTSDWLSTVADVAIHLRQGLPNLLYFQQDENWNHLDFVWGSNAKEVVYDKVFELLKQKPQ